MSKGTINEFLEDFDESPAHAGSIAEFLLDEPSLVTTTPPERKAPAPAKKAAASAPSRTKKSVSSKPPAAVASPAPKLADPSVFAMPVSDPLSSLQATFDSILASASMQNDTARSIGENIAAGQMHHTHKKLPRRLKIADQPRHESDPVDVI